MEEFPSSSTRYDKLIHQIVQLNTDLQKTAALTQTLKSERDALRVTNEKLKDESRRLHDKCEKLQQIIVQETEEKIQTHKRHEELIAKWKSQIEQKAKAFENLQKKLAPPRDLEQLRLQIQEELDVPHQQKLKMFQEEVEKYRQSTFNLRRQFESLKSEYEHYAIDQGNEIECLHASYNEKIGALKTKLAMAEERALSSSNVEIVRKLQQNLEGAKVEIKLLQDEIKEVRDEKNRLLKQSSDESTNIALSLSEEKSRCVVLELENKRLLRNLDVQTGEVENLNAKAQETHAKLDQLTLECENLREQLKQRDQMLFDCHSTVSVRLKDEREAWKKEHEQYQERIQELSNRLAMKEQIISGDKDGLATKNSIENNELAKLLQERQHEIEKYQSQVGEMYRKVTEKEDMIRKLQNQHDDVVAQLKSENNTIQKAAQVTLLEKERAQAKQQTLQELVNRMKSESLSIRGKFKDLENEYRVLQQKQREIMQANEELHLEINGRNASIKYLEQDVTNLTASLEIEKEAHHKAIETMKNEYKCGEADFRKEQNILKLELKKTLRRLGRELIKVRKKRDAYKKKCIEVHEKLKETMSKNDIMESKLLSMKQEHISETQQLLSKLTELEIEKTSSLLV